LEATPLHAAAGRVPVCQNARMWREDSHTIYCAGVRGSLLVG
jgi:hypothetical protein